MTESCLLCRSGRHSRRHSVVDAGGGWTDVDDDEDDDYDDALSVIRSVHLCVCISVISSISVCVFLWLVASVLYNFLTHW